MSSRLPRDEALEKEDRIDKMKKKNTQKNSPSIPHLLQAQQAPALPYAEVVACPSTGSYPAPLPDPTTHHLIFNNSLTIWEIHSKFGIEVAMPFAKDNLWRSAMRADPFAWKCLMTDMGMVLKNCRNRHFRGIPFKMVHISTNCCIIKQQTTAINKLITDSFFNLAILLL